MASNSKDIKNKECPACKIVFLTCAIVSAILLVVSFFMPPMGAIDPGVVRGSAILLAWGALSQVPLIIKAGADLHIKHKDTEVCIDNPDPTNK